jgi:hypothetical protein
MLRVKPDTMVKFWPAFKTIGNEIFNWFCKNVSDREAVLVLLTPL